MNLVANAPPWLAILLACAMVAAAIEDARRLRISNTTSLAVLAGAIVAAAIEGPTWLLWQNVSVFVAILILGTAAFSAGWFGGGDVKLFAAVGLWFDLRSALQLVVLIFLAGGVIAIVYLLRSNGPGSRSEGDEEGAHSLRHRDRRWRIGGGRSGCAGSSPP